MRPHEQAGIHIGESCAFADGPAVRPISEGQRRRADELGWRFTSLDATLSPHRQVEHLARLVELGVDAITAFTLDANLAEPAYERVVAAGIPIITFGPASPSATATIRQRVDSDLCAVDAVEFIVQRVPGARVLVIGGPPIPALAARTRQFLDAAERAALRIVAREDNVGDVEETARPIVRRLLDRQSDVDAIWCFNDYTALAAAAELARRGIAVQSGARTGTIVSGIGGIPAVITAIRDGRVTFTYDSRPIDTGRTAIDLIERLIVHNERPAREAWIDFTRYDLTNVSEYASWDECLPLITRLHR
jgi:ribose transport system substrate-binding protein